jgi:hypothetical protein
MMAGFVTDLMYRSYFVLHREVKGTDPEVLSNPWPNHVR